MHYFEGPFDEVNSRGSYPTLLDDLILSWIKTHWMDMTYGICNYTVQQQLQKQESLTKLRELQKKIVHGRCGIPTQERSLFFFFQAGNDDVDQSASGDINQEIETLDRIFKYLDAEDRANGTWTPF